MDALWHTPQIRIDEKCRTAWVQVGDGLLRQHDKFKKENDRLIKLVEDMRKAEQAYLQAEAKMRNQLQLVMKTAEKSARVAAQLRSKDLKNCKVAKSNSLIERYMEKSVAGFEKQLSDWIKAHKKVLGMPNAKQRLPMR